MSKKYTQKFRKEWLNHPKLKDWIKESASSNKAYCQYCKCDIVSKLSDLVAHSETKKHMNAIGYTTKNNPIPFKRTNYKLQQQEATLSMYIAVHSSIAPVDHLGQVCNIQFDCSSLKLHRTKCTKLIKNVLAPHFNQDFSTDIGNSFYSLLIDETYRFQKFWVSFIFFLNGHKAAYHIFLVFRFSNNILQQKQKQNYFHFFVYRRA